MGKFVFFAAILAALVAVSMAQGVSVSEQRFRDAQCRREVQENPLDSCRQVVDRLLTGRVGVIGAVPFHLDARAQCCQQLQGVSRGCRCSAIRQMVRDYEQAMVPLEGGYGGDWPAEQREQQGYYGEEAERQQQGSEGYYGETARRQQGQEYYGERPQQQQQQHGEGYYGEAAERQQGEEYYGGERPRQQQQQGEEGYYGEAARRQQQQGEEVYGGERRSPRITRVRLTKVRQYVARLPNMCQMEPQECSVFSYDQY